jgi:leucine-zipper of insertion element IS481
MAHANARLTEFGRLLLVQRITELGWPPALAAETWGCRGPRPTSGWAATESRAGPDWLIAPRDRTAVPHALPASQVRRVLAARRRRRQGPHRLGYHLGMARSTVYGVLRRHGMNRLAHSDRTSGVVVRYQREHPSELVHLDVKKLGRIPTAAATASTAAPMGPGDEASATTTSTRPWMTAPGSPSARSCPMRPAPLPPDSWSRRPGSSPSMA